MFVWFTAPRMPGQNKFLKNFWVMSEIKVGVPKSESTPIINLYAFRGFLESRK